MIWEAPPPESHNGDITGYKVRYRPHAGRSKTQLLTTPADIRSVTLNNLDRMATYQVLKGVPDPSSKCPGVGRKDDSMDGLIWHLIIPH